ncbi:MAG: hypothetical protein HY868_21245 [Chloroflexi bacterium]|nr:hypothetical protein [Chloroflexota bacterium]
MEFQVGDTVFHPVHGVGHIVAIAENELIGHQARMYYQITMEHSTVWVPVEAHLTIGLRHLTSKRDLARYRSVLKSRPTTLDDDHTKRRVAMTNQLKEGSLQIVCQLVRDLTARGWHKRLTQVDTTTLLKAREKLEQEWAAAAGISSIETSAEIDALLLEGKQHFMT